MLRQIVAFLAVATSVAFATTCGFCYPGYGSYVNSVPVLGAGVCNNGFYGSRILSSGYVNSAVAPEVCASPAFRATVGGPEVISSCENSIASPLVPAGVYSSGLYGFGYGFGGRRGGIITTAC